MPAPSVLVVDHPSAPAPGAVPVAGGGGERRRFASLLAHEVRAPLAVIRSYAEILLSCPPDDPEERRRFLRAMVDEADRIQRLLEAVTEVEKLEAGGVPLVPAPCDLGELAERATLQAYRLAALKELDLASETVAEAGLVAGDPQQLLRAIQELVENAVRFSLAGGRVRVRTVAWDDGRLVSVEVSDEGIGVAPAARDRIFEKFFQGAVPPDGVSPRGAGLGLTLVRLIAERHGGAVTYRDRPGRGSVFTLTLPGLTASRRPR